jgi:hypothetical protein
MSDTVVDSSVVAKWILPEADSAQADRLMAEVALPELRWINWRVVEMVPQQEPDFAKTQGSGGRIEMGSLRLFHWKS